MRVSQQASGHKVVMQRRWMRVASLLPAATSLTCKASRQMQSGTHQSKVGKHDDSSVSNYTNTIEKKQDPNANRATIQVDAYAMPPERHAMRRKIETGQGTAARIR
jgi:hypothetical protein